MIPLFICLRIFLGANIDEKLTSEMEVLKERVYPPRGQER
jgi:hypothetical protein